MASGNGENYSKVIMIPFPDKFGTDKKVALEFVNKLLRTYLTVYGEETKMSINRRDLEKVLKNLPDCYDFLLEDRFSSNKNFYLVKIYNEDNTEIYVESLDKRYSKLKPGETKILINKRDLEKVLKNLPENCPICKSKFSEDNFYLVDIACGCCAETYIECVCENYRDVVVEMR